MNVDKTLMVEAVKNRLEYLVKNPQRTTGAELKDLIDCVKTLICIKSE